jgi:hypothetical protein
MSLVQSTRDILYGRLGDFTVDIDRLRRFYHDTIEPAESTLYHDNGVSYDGWAITSRDGTVSDGVRRIDRSKGGPKGLLPTPLCQGVMNELLNDLSELNLEFYRVRIMRLVSSDYLMKFHSDADVEKWRIHIPIETNPRCFFEWRLPNGHIQKTHLPADGSAWLVRVDPEHRASNEGPADSQRIHVVMSLTKRPVAEAIEEPFRFDPGPPMPKRQAPLTS